MRTTFITILFVFVLTLIGCGEVKESNHAYNEPVVVSSQFTMTMEERNSFYYPTIKGNVVSPVYPSKLEAFFDNKVFELDMSVILKIGEGYLISLDTVHIFGCLNQGDYTVKLKAYDGNKFYILDCETVFVVDELYTAITGFNMETGENVSAMDKESNWIGPFYGDNLSVEPVINGGDFIVSGFDNVNFN